MSRDELLKIIKNQITEHLVPIIEGKETKTPIAVAHFLYRLGFIIARSESSEGGSAKNVIIDNERREYEHYHFHDMPDFLTSRTDNDFGVKWEIHPCYREALDIKKLNRYQRDKRLKK